MPIPPESCAVCQSVKELKLCNDGCRMMVYCSKEHQELDHSNHEGVCEKIRKCRELVEEEERKLRSHPGGGNTSWGNGTWALTPPGAVVFEEHVGKLEFISTVRPYMSARDSYVQAILEINTLRTVEEAVIYAEASLRLSHRDDMKMRDYLMSLYLRLDRDQQCYDFVKWWATHREYRRDWEDVSLPFLNTHNANVFEPIEPFGDVIYDHWIMSALLLIKVRLLLQIKEYQKRNALLLKHKLPPELVRMVQRFTITSIVADNPDFKENADQSSLIEELETQIEDIKDHLHDDSRIDWARTMDGIRKSTPKPEKASDIVHQRLQVCLRNHTAFAESPEAMEMAASLFSEYWSEFEAGVFLQDKKGWYDSSIACPLRRYGLFSRAARVRLEHCADTTIWSYPPYQRTLPTLPYFTSAIVPNDASVKGATIEP